MPIDASTRKVFETLGLIGDPQPQDPNMTIEDFRSLINIFVAHAGKAADVPFIDSTVPARDGYAIPIRIYNPALDASYPTLIFYPGSGYILEAFEVNAIAVSRIAKAANCKVILVDYRLCPENPLPVPYHDAYDATAYIATHPDIFHMNPNNLFIAGISSGAHAAAQVASLSRLHHDVQIKRAILLNGFYDASLKQNTYAHFEKEDKLCTRDGLQFMIKQFGLQPDQLEEGEYSPLLNQDVASMPPTTIIVGEYDGLRSDSEAYYSHLASDPQNIVDKIVLPGQTHSVLTMRGSITDGDDPAEVIASLIKGD